MASRHGEVGLLSSDMKTVVSAIQSKAQDAAYEGDLGAVMERAGYAVANRAAAMGVGYGSRVAVLCGVGNNGGDGYVAARHLARRGASAMVHSLGEPKTLEAIAAAAEWSAAGGKVAELGAPVDADIVIDALFGVGFRGELPTSLSAWHGPLVVAIDVVSGLDATSGEVADGALAATHTVALSHFKIGHFLGQGPAVTGQLELAELGLPEAEASLLLCEAADAPRPARSRTAHKWSAGSVAVVGGSDGMAGAAVLAAKAALNFGAGAVATFVPGGLAAELDAAHPEIMTNGLGDGSSLAGVDVSAVVEATDRFDVVIVGPGMGPDAADLVGALVPAVPQPLVLDADGLNAISVDVLAERTGRTIVTPHGGEFARLAGAEPTFDNATALSISTDSIVLLKGPATVIASGAATPWLVTSGGPELATVGTGDVLAGMIGALVSRGLEPVVAARSGAYWHGEAGASLAATSSVTAETLAEEVRRFAN